MDSQQNFTRLSKNHNQSFLRYSKSRTRRNVPKLILWVSITILPKPDKKTTATKLKQTNDRPICLRNTDASTLNEILLSLVQSKSRSSWTIQKGLYVCLLLTSCFILLLFFGLTSFLFVFIFIFVYCLGFLEGVGKGEVEGREII